MLVRDETLHACRQRSVQHARAVVMHLLSAAARISSSKENKTTEAVQNTHTESNTKRTKRTGSVREVIEPPPKAAEAKHNHRKKERLTLHASARKPPPAITMKREQWSK